MPMTDGQSRPKTSSLTRKALIYGGGALAGGFIVLMGAIDADPQIWPQAGNPSDISGAGFEPALVRDPFAFTLTPTQRRQLGLGAILGEMDGAYIDALKTGLYKWAISSILTQDWNVTDAQSAHDNMGWLLNQGGRAVLNVAAQAYLTKNDGLIGQSFSDSDTVNTANSYLDNFGQVGQTLQNSGIFHYPADITRLGFAGWDAGRAVFVARLCYDAGYFDKATAWDAIGAADTLARQNFTSWTDFAQSYVLGRAGWGGDTLDLQEVITIYNYLQSNPGSPWRKYAWAA